ncbi:MAG: 50S ribosomal protein L29 [Bdellovibrionales bacterium]|jgi:large subunit ribosomal protein L29|nr:50S ribosomal protein L29 [Bdellovibrionales bacterium]
MLFSEITGLSAKELVKRKRELQAELFEARMKNSLGQLANQMTIRAARKDIARLNTALTLLVSKGSTAGTASKSAAGAKKTVKKSSAKAGAAKKASKKPVRGKKG